MPEAAFAKHDFDKPRLELVPQSAIDAMGDILTFGAKKYSPNNWKKCEDPTRYEGALLRHIGAYRRGENLDPETGKPHLWHALTCVAFLVELDEASKNALLDLANPK